MVLKREYIQNQPQSQKNHSLGAKGDNLLVLTGVVGQKTLRGATGDNLVIVVMITHIERMLSAMAWADGQLLAAIQAARGGPNGCSCSFWTCARSRTPLAVPA